jgi:hypothetical protein
MISVPLATGFFPERWKKAIDVVLEKIPGFVRSNKLWIIQLLEADLNQVLRIAFTRNIAKLAKNNKGVIRNHQYGRAHATCMTPVLNKLLTVQLLIQKRTEGIVFDNDAKGCYDRIIIGVALASLRRLGYSKESVKMWFLLWAHMEHHVCTGFGVSDKTGSTNEDPKLEPVSTDQTELTTSEETIIAKMEEIIHFFLYLLQVTGGDLAPEKCVGYLISHRWKDVKPKLLQKHSSHRGIKIVSRSTSTESGVKRKAPNEGHRTLGFFMTGDGTCSAHKRVMTQKASLYAIAIQRSSVWKGEYGLAYNSFYLPSIGYGTPARTLTQQ